MRKSRLKLPTLSRLSWKSLRSVRSTAIISGSAFPMAIFASPDMTFVRSEKLPGGKSPDSFGEFIPDLAVEVLYPYDSLKEVGRKIGEFLECGVPLVWLVDPAHQTVTVYRSLSDTAQYSA